MRRTVKWTMAILFSLAAHAGAAVLLLPREEASMIAGAAPFEVALLGNSFEDTIEAGTPDGEEAVTPIEEETNALQPIEAETAAVTPEDPIVTPEMPTADIQPENVDPLPESSMTDVAPSEADVILPAEESPPVVADEPEIVAALPPAEVVPLPRPEPPKVVEEQPKPKRVAEPKPEPKDTPAPQRRKRGAAGQSETASIRGSADGADNGRSAASSVGEGRTQAPLGSAAESNYKGKVQDRVNRLANRLARKNRTGLNGSTLVAFAVTRSGGATAVRLTRSTGSPDLDAAIVSGIQGLSFPKFPAGYSRPTWTFTMPIRFR
ncbi:TonB family protein [Rhizobium sp. YIM 134829]|uniref:energy transducer TonB family protein n=1 Tax=Rhizobium sp. YIM 134829 TaxID=3390453 RepID=UPI003978D86A